MDKVNIRCPQCSYVQEVEIPRKSCLSFYLCAGCHKIISAPKDVCCVICVYSDSKCPKGKLRDG